MTLIYIDRNMTKCLYRIGGGIKWPCFFAISPISLIGSIVPISLFANITEMRMGSGRIAFSSSSNLTNTELIYIQISNLKASLLQVLTGVQNRMVLNLGRDNVLALCLICLCCGNQRQLSDFRAAVGTSKFVGLCAQRFRDRLAGLCNRSLRLCRNS